MLSSEIWNIYCEAIKIPEKGLDTQLMYEDFPGSPNESQNFS